MDIKIITKDNEEGLLLSNNPFAISGELVVKRNSDCWSYDIKRYSQAKMRWQTFPDENYSLKDVNNTGFALGAFDNNQSIGLAIFQDQRTKYLYLADLKVSKKYRRRGVAKLLLNKAKKLAEAQKYLGFWVIAQNNNLGACLFYLKYGFIIGGLDTKVYDHSSQAEKQNVHFYYDF